MHCIRQLCVQTRPWAVPRGSLSSANAQANASLRGAAGLVLHDVVQGSAHGRDLRGVALLGRRAGTIWVHLRGGGVRRVGGARAQSEQARLRDPNHALLYNLLADDLAFGVRGRDVRDAPHSVNDGRVPRQLRVGAVCNEVKAVGDGVGRGGDAVARRLGRSELRLVRVRRLVQIHMAHPLLDTERAQQREQRGALFRCRLRVEAAPGHHLAVRVEAAVRVHRLRVPPLHGLVSPRAHGRAHKDVERRLVRRCLSRQERQRALNPRRLVAVHTTSDEDWGLVGGPALGARRPQRVPALAVRQHAVLEHVEGGLQRLELREHLVGVGALDYARREPLGLLRVVPGPAGLPDAIRLRRRRHCRAPPRGMHPPQTPQALKGRGRQAHAASSCDRRLSTGSCEAEI
mmetsp:Transcript_10064/g.33006  ORF Transcript_10064/g.33006 Transcript_10064/m.33006 type:complete len:402 (+) Transcript_10064:1359-2564(+)